MIRTNVQWNDVPVTVSVVDVTVDGPIGSVGTGASIGIVYRCNRPKYARLWIDMRI